MHFLFFNIDMMLVLSSCGIESQCLLVVVNTAIAKSGDFSISYSGEIGVVVQTYFTQSKMPSSSQPLKSVNFSIRRTMTPIACVINFCRAPEAVHSAATHRPREFFQEAQRW